MVFTHQEHGLQSCLLPAQRGTLCCQDLFSSSAIIASHSCSPCHADCLAFSFLGGSTEALTCSFSLRSTSSFSLPLCARQHSPLPTGLPERGLLKDKLSPLSPSLILHLSPSPNFSIVSLYLFSLCLSIYQSQLFSQLLRSCVSERWKRCLTVKKRTCSFVSYYTSQGAVAVCGYQPLGLLLPPPNLFLCTCLYTPYPSLQRF